MPQRDDRYHYSLSPIKMKIKNPIYSFSLIALLICAVVILSLFGLWGIYSLIYLLFAYSILVAISYGLQKINISNRITIEYCLILLFVVSHALYYYHWDVGTEIYFDNNKEPFTGENQDFIIVFGIENQQKLPDNFLTNNKIQIPENGILLTSSDTKSYKHRYTFKSTEISNRFVYNYFETCNCYREDNHKFEYVIGGLTKSNRVNQKFKDSITTEICNILNKKELKSALESGYRNGSYLDQKEIILNHQNLTSFPEELLPLKNLEYINIHSNDFRRIPSEIYKFQKLKKLYIGYNKIKELPERIGSIKTLESLAINGNELTDLPDTLLALPNLKYLAVRENKFDKQTRNKLKSKYLKRGIKLNFD